MKFTWGKGDDFQSPSLFKYDFDGHKMEGASARRPRMLEIGEEGK